jgi:hypothetical protein
MVSQWFAPLLTALVTVIVAVIGATVADRFTLRRLERIDKLIAETDIRGEHLDLLAQVRENLVERMAFRELRPLVTRWLIFGTAIILGGVSMLVGWSIIWSAKPQDEAIEFGGKDGLWIVLFGATVVISGWTVVAWTVAEREAWARHKLPLRFAEREHQRSLLRLAVKLFLRSPLIGKLAQDDQEKPPA